MSVSQQWAALSSRWNALFRDHEIFVRTGGDVRFLTLSARVQRRAALAVGALLLAWALFTIVMLVVQAAGAAERRDVAARAAAVEQAEARVAAESNRVENVARDLNRRQDDMESLFLSHFGDAAAASGDAAQATDKAAARPAATPTAVPDKLSMLRAVRARQDRLVLAMSHAVAARAARAEEALRKLGIRPDAATGQGGPFIPYPNRAGLRTPRDPAMLRLAVDLDRMQSLEDMVLSLPSSRPAEVIRLSSGFGYRRDPFTGAGAMHSGLDFTGAHGSPIRAAAAGRISHVGRMSGYGNAIEVDHGHGIITRYAHLSGYAARVGQMVAAGDVIARMGSTGRSTGTHLHFEVRVGGTAVNPLRFLEANPDVLEIKAIAGQRSGARRAIR